MMDKAAKILHLFIFAVFLCVSSFAQNKIAVVNGYLFYNEKLGIKKLTKMVSFLDTQHNGCTYSCGPLRREIVKLTGEIEQLKALGKSVADKTLELSNVEKELENIMEKDRSHSKKLYSIFVEPIEKQIKDKLKLFEKEKGYLKILDLSDDKTADGILYIDESIDITDEFIKFCNEEFEKEKAQKR